MTESEIAWIKCCGGDSLKQWLDINQNDFRSIGPSLPLTDQELERHGGSCMSGHEGCPVMVRVASPGLINKRSRVLNVSAW